MVVKEPCVLKGIADIEVRYYDKDTVSISFEKPHGAYTFYTKVPPGRTVVESVKDLRNYFKTLTFEKPQRIPSGPEIIAKAHRIDIEVARRFGKSEEWMGQSRGNPPQTPALQEIIKKENEYFKRYGGPTEADFAINDIQREKIRAYHRMHPNTLVGLINKHGRKNFLQVYQGEKVLNFEWDFIIPQYDAELLKLLTEREQAPYTGTKEDAVRIDKIYERIKQSGGLYLYWA